MPRLSYTIPPPSLMIELREVAADSGALAAELARATANRPLPAEFPAEQLQELLVGLQSLPSGTAEGCRQPLEYARARLPAIRRNFIQTEEQSRQPHADEDVPPPLTRGMTIDVRIGALVNSVTTALDEYRALASVQDDDAADTAPSLDIDTTAPDVVSAMAASQRAEQALGEHVAELQRTARPESVTADNLKRQMRDTRGLLSLARIELRMPGFVPDWYRKTVDTIRDYPRILRATARLMQIGVDVARPLAEAWHQFERDLVRSGINAVETAAKGFLQVAEKWKAERTGRVNETATNAAAPPPYLNLDAARAMILRGEAPPISWRPGIELLNFTHENLNDLAPVAGLAALEGLFLDYTQVSDLAPLAGLNALLELSVACTQVSDLAPLAGLAALRWLSLSSTEVSDLAPLAGLNGLLELSVGCRRVSDLAPLAGLAALEGLSLHGAPVSDLAPLARLTALQTLSLSGTRVSDLAPLASLAALQRLYLDNTPVSDLAPLAGLAALETLSLDGAPVSDLAPLAGLTALWCVYVESEERCAALARTLPGREDIIYVSNWRR